MAELRDYQTTALEQVKEAARRGVRRMMLQMPTGAGKTRLAAEIVNGAQSKKKRVIFTVPAISLVDQTMEMFYAEGIRDVGVIQANHERTDWRQPIQIASVQTLMKRTIPQADVVLRDEAHKLFKFDTDWMKLPSWEQVPFIGLSATPWTKGLGRHYQQLIIGTTTRELIDKGWLSRFRVFAPSHPDLSGVGDVAGDYNAEQLAVAMNREPLTADAVETWLKYADGRPTICFAVDCAHAQALQKKFTDAGVPTGYMDAYTPLLERSAIRRQFERGDITVLCNVDIMGFGMDWPEVSCISYCRPTRSEIRFVQNIGRGLRKHESKQDLLILDHSDTTLRLGFVTDIHHDVLHGGKERKLVEVKPKPLPKECKKCHYLRPPGNAACPNCGHKAEPKASDIQHGNGELREYTELPSYKKPARKKFTPEDKAQCYAEMKGYALERGFKPGWAYHKFHLMFECYPSNGLADVAAVTPSEKMRSWCKHVNIRYAMGKAGNVHGNEA